MSREDAIKKLLELGVELGESGDVRELKEFLLARKGQKRYSKLSQCTRKRRHPTKDEAVRVMGRMGNPYLEPYRCSYCALWHIGNAPGGG